MTMTKEYKERAWTRLWAKIWRTNQPITRKDAEDFPFTIEVAGKGSKVNIKVTPDIKAVTNEVLPLVSRTVATKIHAFEYTANTPANRERLTKDLETALVNLWVQGLIEPKVDDGEPQEPQEA
jgi:hypothetical protein